jgi:hypothetical protein
MQLYISKRDQYFAQPGITFCLVGSRMLIRNNYFRFETRSIWKSLYVFLDRMRKRHYKLLSLYVTLTKKTLNFAEASVYKPESKHKHLYTSTEKKNQTKNKGKSDFC